MAGSDGESLDRDSIELDECVVGGGRSELRIPDELAE
jgi:hypothetical protein